jgi:hypothetical protein
MKFLSRLFAPLGAALLALILAPAALAAPTVSITSPLNGTSLGTVSSPAGQTIVASASAGAGASAVISVDFRVNGTSIGTVTAAPYQIVWTPTQPGTYTLTALATDNAASNNTTTSAPSIVTVSAVRVVSLVAPTTGTSVPQDSSLFLRSTVSMSDAVVSKVDFYVNALQVGSVSRAPYNLAYSAQLAAGASYAVFARATLSDNSTIDSATSQLNVVSSTGTAPTVSVTAPSSGSFAAVGSSVTLSAIASDADGFIPTSAGGGVTFYVDGDPVGTDLTAPYSITWSPSLAKGYTIRALAVDDKGNQTISNQVTFTAVAAMPTVAITAPANNATGVVGGAVTISANPTASTGATVTSVSFAQNGTAIGTPVTVAPYSVSFTPASAGSYALTATVTDSAGISVTSSTVNYTATAAQPSVSLTAPAIGATLTVNSPVSVTAAATPGTGATISQVQFLQGSTIIGTLTSAPYTITWTPTTTGNVSLTAKVLDSNGNSTTSTAVTATVVSGPTVTLTTPANNSSATVGSAVTVTASPTPTTGATVSRVTFFANGAQIGNPVLAAPYTVAWTPASAGTVNLTATVQDSTNQTSTSNAVAVAVSNSAPTVSLSAPTQGAVLSLGSSATLTAAVAAGSGGATVTQVQFLSGSSIIATLPGVAGAINYSTPWTPTTAGNVSLTAKVVDSNGNSTTSTAVTATVVSGLAVSLTTPANNSSATVGTPVTLTASAVASPGATVSRVTFFANGTQVGAPVLTAPFTVAWTPASAGAVNLTATVLDSANQTTTSAAVAVTVANAAPTATLSAPSQGAVVNVGTPVTLTTTVAAGSGGATVTQVQFLSGSAIIATLPGLPATNTYSTSWTPSAAGNVALSVKVTDSNGTSVTSGAVNVTVVSTAPTISLSSPAAGAVLGLGASTTLAANVTVATGLSVSRVEFLQGSTVIGTSLSAPYAVNWTPSAAGVTTLTARVTDSLGTVVTSSPINVLVNSPTVTLTAPAAGASVPLNSATTLTAAATAVGPALVAKVEFYANSVLVGTSTSAPYTVPWTPFASGTTTLQARATDTNGTQVSSSTVAVTVSAGGPTVALSSPAAGASALVGTTISLTASASTGAPATVAKVEFFADGLLVGTKTSSPYTVTWTPLVSGLSLITAKVTDSTGATATSQPTVFNALPVGAPSVSLAVTGGNSSVASGSSRFLLATAADDGAITRVDFVVDGVVVGSTTKAPYAYLFTAAAPLGARAVTAVAYDNSGNATTSNVVTLDITASVGQLPGVGIVQPSAGAFVAAGSTVTISGNAFDADGTVSSVTVFIGGVTGNGLGLAANGAASISGNTWSTTWTPSGAGPVSISALAVDDKGNAVAAPAVTVNITDSSAPVISLSASPGSATLPTKATRNILASVAPAAGRAILRVEFFVDGAKVAEDTTAPYSFRYTAPAAAGTSIVTARVTDNSGLSRDAQLQFAVVNAVGQGPSANLITPVNNSAVVPNTSINLAATAVASGGTISSVQFYQNGSPVGSPITSPPYTSSFVPTLPGSYVFDAIATDDRGNTKISNASTVTAAFGTPTITITNPKADITKPNNAVRVTPNIPLTIAASATAGSGASILIVEFLVDDVQVGTRTSPSAGNTVSGTYSFPWTPDLTMLGSHVITTRVTDTNSVTATSTPININVATVVGTPPSITIVAPGNGATIQTLSTTNLIANSFATGGTISSVEFFLNDASIGLAAREQTTNAYRIAYDFSTVNYSALTPDASGRYPVSYYAIAKDSNGNQTVTPTYTLYLSPSQSFPPSVQLSTLGLTPTVTAGTPFPLVAAVSDGDGNVSNLALYVNGSTGAFYSQGSPTQNTPIIIQYTPAAAGRFNVYAVVTDDTGNTAVSSPIVINVTGNTAPTAVLVRPTDDSTVTTVSTPVFLEATASDPDIGQTVSVTFINTLTGQTLATGTRVGLTDTYRAIWTPSQANTYSVAARSADNVGGSTTSTASRRVVVNNVVGIAPTISTSIPTSASTASTANFIATASDSDGSVVGVEFFMNRISIGQAVRDQQTNTWRLVANYAGVNVGTVEVVALARDSSGNVAASSTTFVSLSAAQSIAPSITLNASSTNVPYSRQVQLTASARDSDGSVSSVQYFANGSSIGTSTNAGTNYQINWTPTQSGVFNVYAVATDSSVNGVQNTTVSAQVPITVRRNNPIIDDSAFILQAYADVANNTSVNSFILDSLDAQLSSKVLTRAELVSNLTTETGFVAPVNLLAAYYTIMGQWPTPTNYNNLIGTARGSLANAIGSILSSAEYIAKYPEHVAPTVALLNNPTSLIPAATFLNRIWQNSGRGGSPTSLDLVQFMNNDTANVALGISRGYNPAGLNTAISEFITIKNANNTSLFNRAKAAALYYQIDRPPVTVTTDEIAARVTALAALPDTKAIAEAVLQDVYYSYRYVTITKHPVSLTVAARSGAIFSVEATGMPPLAYQWLLNGAPVPGGTASTLNLTNVDASRAGTYTVVVTSTTNTATSDPATLSISNQTSRLSNISTRGSTAGGANVLIGGFVVTGAANQTRQMLVRVVGPTLGAAPFNVGGTLGDPRLEIYGANPSTPLVTNDNWGTQSGNAAANTTALQTLQQATTRAGAFALANNSQDAAVVATLAPGNYTVQAKGPNANASGVVLLEVYDVTTGNGGPKAANVSTRAQVGTGNNILIAGFVINGPVSRRVLIRGVGPSLRNFGLPANQVLADPELTLVNQTTGATIKVNDDWAGGDDAAFIASAASAAGAFPLANGSKDSAMLVMLPQGVYTVQLRGVGNTTGIGMVEVYDVDP